MGRECIADTCPASAGIIAYRDNGKIRTAAIEMDENEFVRIVKEGNRKILPEVMDALDRNITPFNVRGGSHKKAVCMSDIYDDNGNMHRVVWMQYVYNIERKGCPYTSVCSKDIWRGYNDLMSARPDIAGQWDYEKNYPLTPYDVTCGSNMKVWWIADFHDEVSNQDFHYEWDASICNRICNGTGCPYTKHSKMEQAVYGILKDMGVKFKAEAKIDGCSYKSPLRFDIYIPKKHMAIEMDGIQHFHAVDFFGGTEAYEETRKRDGIKDAFCMENKIRLLRIPYTYICGNKTDAIENAIRNFLGMGNIDDEIVDFYREQGGDTYMQYLRSCTA